jgi:hypothetical protein
MLVFLKFSPDASYKIFHSEADFSLLIISMLY